MSQKHPLHEGPQRGEIGARVGARRWQDQLLGRSGHGDLRDPLERLVCDGRPLRSFLESHEPAVGLETVGGQPAPGDRERPPGPDEETGDEQLVQQRRALGQAHPPPPNPVQRGQHIRMGGKDWIRSRCHDGQLQTQFAVRAEPD